MIRRPLTGHAWPQIRALARHRWPMGLGVALGALVYLQTSGPHWPRSGTAWLHAVVAVVVAGLGCAVRGARQGNHPRPEGRRHPETPRATPGPPLTKAAFVAQVRAASSGPPLTAQAARALVDAVFATVGTTLTREGRFAYRGFGTLTVHTRAAHLGRHPRTGAALWIAARPTVGFTPASRLKQTLEAASDRETPACP